jgi:PAS domain S-box-containing protein
MSTRRPYARWLPWAAFVGGSALTAVASWGAWSRERMEAGELFGHRADLVQATLTQRLRVYEQAVLAATGLFSASEDVSRAEWHEYVQHTGLSEALPGLEAVEFRERVPRAALQAHVRRVRGEGLPDYHVWPAGTGGDAFPVVYSESPGNRLTGALGYDAGSEPVRREALERARDSGLPAFSGRLLLARDSAGPGEPGLIIAAPTYQKGMPLRTVAERRAALAGFVSFRVDAERMIRGMLTLTPQGVDVELYDQRDLTPGGVLFDSDSVPRGAGAGPPPRFSRMAMVEVGGRPWTLFMSPGAAPLGGPYRTPLLVLLGGLTLSLAVSLGLRAESLVGERAEALATRMTAELRGMQHNLERDVAERRKVETALRESEERYRAMLENTPLGIYVDVDGQFVYANRELLRILAASSLDAVLGTPILPRIAPEFRAAVRKRALAATANREPTNPRQLQLLRLDGTVIDVEASALPTTFDGRPATQVQVRDVSERRQAERARESLEAQLRQAQKMEAIGTLAGGIAHDFNNILAAIVGYTELARADAADLPAVQESLMQVEKAGARARDLVRQILAFSRREDQTRRPIRLEEVVREVLQLLRASFPAQVTIVSEVSSDAPVVLADPSQVHQVLMNLATNALHAMMPGGGTLTLRETVVDLSEADVTATPGLEPRCYVRLTVADTGCGIEPAVAERVFEPFFTTKDPGRGTGLGLAVVHGIMKSHDGVVILESRVGSGSTFALYFPVHQEEAAGSPIDVSKLARGDGQHVLLVDDEESLARLGSRALQRLGYRVTVETDPLRALTMFQSGPERFDLLLTDLTMPGMNGLELVREVHRIRPALPVVLATGYGGDVDADQARALDIQELLFKPATVAALGSSVRRALTG